MAEENKEAQEAKPEEKKPAAAAVGAEGGEAPAKGERGLYIGLGGGAAVIVALAYFLTVAAVESGAQVQLPEQAVEEQAAEKHEEPAPEESHGEAPAGEEGHGGGEGAEKAPPKENVKTAVAELPEFQTNPAGSGLKRLFNGQFAVKIEADDAPSFVQKLQADAEIKVRLMDGLISLIKSRKPDELEGAANEKLLKRDIANLVNRLIFPNQEGRVVEVAFMNFIVQ